VGSTFIKVAFDSVKCNKEVKDLGKLLESNPELSEKSDIRPFFKSRNQLCAFIGTFAPDIGAAPEIAREFSFIGDYAADLLVGNRDNRQYMAVEFEDGRKNSVFKRVPGRSNTDWSQRFEHGYSQLIDWFATLDDYKKTDKFRRESGKGHIAFSGMLIIGRNSGVSDDDRIRLEWRADKVLVDSHVINCITFDDLHQALERRLELYPAASMAKKKKK
jgi:hypothetical protein